MLGRFAQEKNPGATRTSEKPTFNCCGRNDKLSKFLSLWGTTPACSSLARVRGYAIQKDRGIYEDKSCGNGGFGVGPFQHRRADFVRETQNTRTGAASWPGCASRAPRRAQPRPQRLLWRRTHPHQLVGGCVA